MQSDCSLNMSFLTAVILQGPRVRLIRSDAAEPTLKPETQHKPHLRGKTDTRSDGSTQEAALNIQTVTLHLVVRMVIGKDMIIVIR